MCRKEKRHPNQAPMEIVPPFGDRSWFTPESRIAQAGSGRLKHNKKRDPKGAEIPSLSTITLFIGSVSTGIVVLALILKLVF